MACSWCSSRYLVKAISLHGDGEVFMQAGFDDLRDAKACARDYEGLDCLELTSYVFDTANDMAIVPF